MELVFPLDNGQSVSYCLYPRRLLPGEVLDEQISQLIQSKHSFIVPIRRWRREWSESKHKCYFQVRARWTDPRLQPNPPPLKALKTPKTQSKSTKKGSSQQFTGQNNNDAAKTGAKASKKNNSVAEARPRPGLGLKKNRMEYHNQTSTRMQKYRASRKIKNSGVSSSSNGSTPGSLSASLADPSALAVRSRSNKYDAVNEAVSGSYVRTDRGEPRSRHALSWQQREEQQQLHPTTKTRQRRSGTHPRYASRGERGARSAELTYPAAAAQAKKHRLPSRAKTHRKNKTKPVQNMPNMQNRQTANKQNKLSSSYSGSSSYRENKNANSKLIGQQHSNNNNTSNSKLKHSQLLKNNTNSSRRGSIVDSVAGGELGFGADDVSVSDSNVDNHDVNLVGGCEHDDDVGGHTDDDVDAHTHDDAKNEQLHRLQRQSQQPQHPHSSQACGCGAAPEAELKAMLLRAATIENNNEYDGDAGDGDFGDDEDNGRDDDQHLDYKSHKRHANEGKEEDCYDDISLNHNTHTESQQDTDGNDSDNRDDDDDGDDGDDDDDDDGGGNNDEEEDGDEPLN
eukprot:CAMPEP_0197519044 /NCGR_PEP_ID=MMETSP1318-20131121/4295_1 /TAXON_ID=552666 /ORGANISM="Partenskyella glossopodia, Strain RCC365" /LENGTH=565 /DNA_ID=CAMNT_0043069799 /DNA_START=12 /DNA_END=1709 /DNA_ORIENTATION=-